MPNLYETSEVHIVFASQPNEILNGISVSKTLTLSALTLS